MRTLQLLEMCLSCFTSLYSITSYVHVIICSENNEERGHRTVVIYFHDNPAALAQSKEFDVIR